MGRTALLQKNETSASARDRLELALARIDDPSGEGTRTYLTVYRETACEAAEAADRRARLGSALGPLDGAIISIKDLFDVAGEPTRAGSLVLVDAPPAERDAPIVRRLRKAGAVIVGKTNMSEFAFTGVGANPHYGTPGNPADRTRVPGGSSSGAAVAVTDDMCEIAIGTDTGGSTRIPAALCGVVGYKPTKNRVSTKGAFPLSPTLELDRAAGADCRGLRRRRRGAGGRTSVDPGTGNSEGAAIGDPAGTAARRSRGERRKPI